MSLTIGPYFTIRAALAKDTLEGVAENARKLADSEDRLVARTSAELARATDLPAARRAFGELSRAVIATGLGAEAAPLHLIDCPMAKPYGRWLQLSREIENPYFGSSMLRCGRIVETRAR